MSSARPPFVLPSVSAEPIPWDDALAAVLGYARATRPLKIRTPTYPDGHVVDVRAFSYGVYDCVPASDDDGFAWLDVLVIDGLNGRLSQESIVALKNAGDRAWPYVAEATARAGGRAFWELPIEEVIEPPPAGSTGEMLSAAWAECFHTETMGVALTHKMLHHKRPRLFPLIDRQTLPRLNAHVVPGGGLYWAVIHRELTGNATQFEHLETSLGALLTGPDDVQLERLRLHDILLWLTATSKWERGHSRGKASVEWQTWQELIST